MIVFFFAAMLVIAFFVPEPKKKTRKGKYARIVAHDDDDLHMLRTRSGATKELKDAVSYDVMRDIWKFKDGSEHYGICKPTGDGIRTKKQTELLGFTKYKHEYSFEVINDKKPMSGKLQKRFKEYDDDILFWN